MVSLNLNNYLCNLKAENDENMTIFVEIFFFYYSQKLNNSAFFIWGHSFRQNRCLQSKPWLQMTFNIWFDNV